MDELLLTDEELAEKLGYLSFTQSFRKELHKVCQAQLLKCQQSESAEIASLQVDIEELNILSRGNSEVYEARIKELEIQTKSCGDCDKDIRADERRKVRQDLKDYICEECSTPNFIHVVIPLKIWEEWQK